MNSTPINLHKAGINVQYLGHQVGVVKIPSDFVPRSFAPNINDYTLFGGQNLKEGMIVLIEDTLFREDPRRLDREENELSDYTREKALETARWCVVTDYERRGEIISFTGVYADGTMRVRKYNEVIKWIAINKVEILPVCPEHGVIHQLEGDVDIDKLSENVSSELLGEKLSFSEFFERFQEDPSIMDDMLDSLIGRMFGGIFDAPREEFRADDQRPGETSDEFFERMRDEAEARGEYNSDEKPKLKKNAHQQ